MDFFNQLVKIDKGVKLGINDVFSLFYFPGSYSIRNLAPLLNVYVVRRYHQACICISRLQCISFRIVMSYT